MWPEVRPFSRVAAKSVSRSNCDRQNSAIPKPWALPCVASLSPRRAIRRTFGHSSSRALWSLNFRPTTFGSSPVPLMSLPMRSTSSTSTRSNGSRGISRLASTSSSFSRASNSSGRTASIRAVWS